MKKKIISSILMIAIIVFSFSGCINTNLDENLLIYYDGKYYDSFISSADTYNSFWYPLSEPDITDKAFTCNKDDNIDNFGKKNEVKIEKFSDEELDMFISHTDFWDDWLFCDTNYKFPSLSAENIEKIALKKFTEDKDWVDYYKSDSCITIQNENDIDSIINSLNNIEKSSKLKSYNMNEVNNQAEICVKFKGINALYYLGIIAHADNNVVFYNAHTTQSLFYLIYDENASNLIDA